MKQREFMTKDNHGCEFKVAASYGDKYYQTNNEGKLEQKQETIYKAMGIVAHSLDELKEKVSNI